MLRFASVGYKIASSARHEQAEHSDVKQKWTEEVRPA
jgi:hypothetical protein